MSYETLESLVFDAKNQNITKETAQHELVAWLIRQLSANGLDEDSINKNFRQLSLRFHPDKAHDADVDWLNAYFSTDNSNNRGFLFVLLGMAKEQLLSTKGNDFRDIDELYCTLDSKIAQFKSVNDNIGMFFFIGIKNMIISAREFLKTCDEVAGTNTWASRCLSIMPVVCTGAVVSFAAKELTMVYVTSALLTYLGNKIKQTGSELNIENLESFGESMRSAGMFIFLNSTTFLTTLLTIAFNSSKYTLGAAASLLLIESKGNKFLEAHEWEKRFISDNMKIIVSPLLAYMKSLDAQNFRTFRSGEVKRELLEKLLGDLEAVQHQPTDNIWLFVENILNSALNNEELTGSGQEAKLAINRAIIGLTHVSKPIQTVVLM